LTVYLSTCFSNTPGVHSVVTYDPCDLFVCNGPNGGTGTISAGVIATAAQDIHSYCRLNGKVGGRVVVSDPDNNDQGSVLIQIGVINKDELKVRDVLDDDLVKTKELRSPVHISRPLFRRSDEELPVGIAEGVAEGDDVDMNVVELQNLCADFYNEFIRVRDQETNPNWRNTALIEREYEDEDGRFTVVMGYLARDGLRVDDAARDDRRLEEIIQETGGYWLSAGLRSIFSMHVFRRFVNAQEQEYHEEIGEIVIQAERRTGTPPLLLPGGSGPMA
jgi:hypothetical protein